jgi:hypothetical protein
MRTFLPHDRQADTLPTSFGLADAGKVFPGCVAGCVQVGVNLTSARSAPKQGLRRTVAPMPVTTLAAILAGAPGIDGDHNGARRLSLVGERAAKPGIAPSVLPTTLAWLLGAGADLGQVLEPRSRWAAPRCRQFAWRERGRNPRQPSPTTMQLFQMPLSRVRVLGSQFASELEIPLFNLLPFSPPKKSGSRCRRRLNRDQSRQRDHTERIQGA